MEVRVIYYFMLIVGSHIFANTVELQLFENGTKGVRITDVLPYIIYIYVCTSGHKVSALGPSALGWGKVTSDI